MIAVTGAAGFIGSNLVWRLNRDGRDDIVAVDLDPVAFKVGDLAQTSASHIGLQISLIDAAPTFEIVSARSTAPSLWSWLTASAAEYGIDVA